MSEQPVNYIRHQHAFISHIRKDDRLHSNDISLYFILFYIWNRNFFKQKFQVNRDELMTLSHIGSRDTYINCIKRLYNCGYIIYTKGQRQYEQSWIQMVLLEELKTPAIAFSTTSGTLYPLNSTASAEIGSQDSFMGKTDITFDTGHIISDTTNTKRRPQGSPTNDTSLKPEIVSQSDPKPGHFTKEIKTKIKTGESQTSEQSYAHTNSNPLNPPIPLIEEVVNYFTAEGYAHSEGLLFYYHYRAVGWMAGNYPIRDWKALARKWMSTVEKKDERQSFQKSRRKNHWYNDKADDNDDYSESL